MLGIGAIYGGPERVTMPIGKFVNRLMTMVSKTCADFILGSAIELNVVYHVPGYIKQDFGYEGLRTGSYWKKDKVMMIQVAVPMEISESEDEEVVFRFIFDSLREAGRLAISHFKRRKIDYPQQQQYFDLVDAIEEKFRQTMQNPDDEQEQQFQKLHQQHLDLVNAAKEKLRLIKQTPDDKPPRHTE